MYLGFIASQLATWLGFEPTKLITLEQGIIFRIEACYIQFILYKITFCLFIVHKLYLVRKAGCLNGRLCCHIGYCVHIIQRGAC